MIVSVILRGSEESYEALTIEKTGAAQKSKKLACNGHAYYSQ